MSGQGRPWPNPAPTGPGSIDPEYITQVLRSLAWWCGCGRGRGRGGWGVYDLCPPHKLAGTDVGVGVCVHTVGPDGSGGNTHCHPVLSLLRMVLSGVHSCIVSCFVQRGVDSLLSCLIGHLSSDSLGSPIVEALKNFPHLVSQHPRFTTAQQHRLHHHLVEDS